jgi:hypothetical protein
MKHVWIAWPAVIALSTIAASASVVGGFVSPLRAAIVIWFAFVCPGMAFVRLLGIRDILTEMTYAVALSFAIDGIVATAMVYLHIWSPLLGFGVLGVLSMLGVALQLAGALRSGLGTMNR